MNNSSFGGQTRVLLAEDDVEMRHALGAKLREAGYDVVECQSGEVLWQRVSELVLEEDGESQADLIISDLHIPPGPTGLDVLGLIRRVDWATPFMLITDFDDVTVHHAAARLGAARVFNKRARTADVVSAACELVEPNAF